MEGYNYRLDALQAAILDVKLSHLKQWTEQRRAHARYYNDHLPSMVKKPVEKPGAKHVYYMYVIRSSDRDALMKFLKEKGISCGIHYPIPLHLQPAYKALQYKRGGFPVSEMLANEILSIPLYPELTQEQREYIVDQITTFYEK
jgi:dTDP-4-amino-4,6-dideoxygalactose transaminase